MQMGALAEAGLSECTRDDGTCGPSTSSVLLLVVLFLVGLLAFCAYIAFSVIASASVLKTESPVPSRWLWLLVIWMVPVIGVAGWWLYLRHVNCPTC